MYSFNLLSLAHQVSLEDILTYRPKAREIYDYVVEQPGMLLVGDIIKFSFQGVTTCAVSFVDELFINLQKILSAHGNALMLLVDMSEEVLADIEGALALRNEKDNSRLNLLCYYDSKFIVLGKLENNLQETFKVVTSHEETSARDIAHEFGIEINSASNRLKKLYDLRLLLRRETKDENGRQHLYFLPSLLE